MSTIARPVGKAAAPARQDVAPITVMDVQRSIAEAIAKAMKRDGYFNGVGNHVEYTGKYWLIKDDADAIWGGTRRTKFLELEFRPASADVKLYTGNAESDKKIAKMALQATREAVRSLKVPEARPSLMDMAFALSTLSGERAGLDLGDFHPRLKSVQHKKEAPERPLMPPGDFKHSPVDELAYVSTYTAKLRLALAIGKHTPLHIKEALASSDASEEVRRAARRSLRRSIISLP